MVMLVFVYLVLNPFKVVTFVVKSRQEEQIVESTPNHRVREVGSTATITYPLLALSHFHSSPEHLHRLPRSSLIMSPSTAIRGSQISASNDNNFLSIHL